MKKLFALLLALSLCFAIVGCDNEEETVEVEYSSFCGFILSRYEVNNEYFVFHSIRLNMQNYGSYYERVGFAKKETAPLRIDTLSNKDSFGSEVLGTMKKCVSLSKADIITLLRNSELDITGDDIRGFLVLKEYPCS